MHDHLDAAAIRSKEEIEWLLKVEKSPATLNMRYCIDCKNTIGQVDRPNTNLASEMWVPSQKDIYDAISALSRLGIRAQGDNLHKLLPLSKCAGYFQVPFSIKNGLI